MLHNTTKFTLWSPGCLCFKNILGRELDKNSTLIVNENVNATWKAPLSALLDKLINHESQ